MRAREHRVAAMTRTNRKDVISGRESVKLFSEYAVNQDSVIEKIILTHNREDVLQLNHLVNIVGQDNFAGVLGNRDCQDSLADVLKDRDCQNLDWALAQTGAGLPSADGELTARPRLAAGCLTVTGRQLRAISFVFLGTYLIDRVGRPLIRIERQTQQSEADY